MSLIILQVIPSLIGYIIIVLNFNCATWSLFPKHNFRWWAKLTSIFLIISFRLEQQAWFWVCVVPMVPITFRFIIPLTWCHRRSITSSWSLSSKFVVVVKQHFDSFQDINRIHDEKYQPRPSTIVLSSTTSLTSCQHIPVCVWLHLTFWVILEVFLWISYDLQTQSIIETPCRCYIEECLWYSDFQ